MKENLFKFNIESYPVGYPILSSMNFPSYYGMQDVKVPLYVYRASKKISPCVVVTACIHGDETNSFHIALSVMKKKLQLKKGTLIIIPLVNIYGFMNKARYLPDRKDLNRSFPGLKNGTFGSRFAKFLFDNFSSIGDCYLDLHSGGSGRYNVPQIRGDLKNRQVKKIIDQLSIPLIVNSTHRDGSFRQALHQKKKLCLVFEGGEGLRFDEKVTQQGVKLVLSLLQQKNMIEGKPHDLKKRIYIRKNRWLRAPEGGIIISKYKKGKIIKKSELIAELRSVTGSLIKRIRAEEDCLILGVNKNSLVMAGDAIFNVGFIGTKLPFEEEIFDW
jgi:uncharacterized protein